MGHTGEKTAGALSGPDSGLKPDRAGGPGEEGLFSVVILSYRNEAYIRCAIDSVLGQTYPAVELIVVDDGSPAFSAAGVLSYIESRKGENLRRARVLCSPVNLGTVKSANLGLAQARGAYIKLLGADDALYDGTVLTRARECLDADGGGILVGRVIKCGADLRPRGPFRDRFARGLSRRTPRQVWRRLCVHNEIAAPGVFFTRDFFRRFGPFDERYRLLEDWPAWLRAARQGVRLPYGDFDAVKYRADAGSATGLNRDYMKDRERAFQYEIRPYRKDLGPALYLLAWLSLKIRNSTLLRRAYGRLFR